MLDDAEHQEAEEDADQAIPDHGSAEGRAKAREVSLVEREADLLAAVGDAGRAEVHPGGDGGASAEDQPEAPDGLDVGKQVDQSDQTHKAPDRGAAEAEEALLVTRPDGRQRHDEATDH